MILYKRELHPPASERPPFGLKRRKGHTSQGMETARLNTLLALALTRWFRLYPVAATSAFKTDGCDRTRFERSFSMIRPKLRVYEHLKSLMYQHLNAPAPARSRGSVASCVLWPPWPFNRFPHWYGTPLYFQSLID